MKTKYFKSGILVAAAWLCAAAFSSCSEDVTVGEWNGTESIETGLSQTGALLQDAASGKSNASVELWTATHTADLRLVLTKAPAEGFTARAKVDTEYDIAQYNKGIIFLISASAALFPLLIHTIPTLVFSLCVKLSSS